jgi:transcriptional accessory protein Tex/SPT6
MSEQTTPQPSSIGDLEPKMRLQGTVTGTQLYGAFVDIGLERDGLVHISKMDKRKIRKVSDEVNVGDEVSVWVDAVDPDMGRISLTMVEPPDVDWRELQPGQVYEGEVVRLERYGAFIDIGAERPGLLHVRQMGQYVRNPQEVVSLGDRVEVRVTSVDLRKHQIDFTMETSSGEYQDEDDQLDPALSPMEIAFLQAQAQSEERREKVNRKRRKNRYDDDDDQDIEDIFRRTLQNG